MDDVTMERASKILLRFVEDEEGKVRYGLKLRKQYFEAQERGEELNDYRSSFVSRASIEIFGWLETKCTEFAEKYPQDRLSTEDLKDILITAHSRLVEKTGG